MTPKQVELVVLKLYSTSYLWVVSSVTVSSQRMNTLVLCDIKMAGTCCIEALFDLESGVVSSVTVSSQRTNTVVLCDVKTVGTCCIEALFDVLSCVSVFS